MNKKIEILIASMTGNAEMAADAALEVLEDEGWAVRMRRMEKSSKEEWNGIPLLLIYSSTYGEGEVPDNGKPLYELLQKEKPDLSHMRYAVFGLGDRKNYPATYNNGGRLWDDLLSELGATRVVERYKFDASSGAYADEASESWIEDVLDLFQVS